MAFVTPLTLARGGNFRNGPVTSRVGSSSVPRMVPQRRAALNMPRMLVLEAESIEDMDKILDNADDSLVVVDYSTSWCGPCKVFAPIFEELSEKHKEVVFVKVMGDASAKASELMRREGIRAVPAFHFWKEKKRVKDITGARRDDVEGSITELK